MSERAEVKNNRKMQITRVESSRGRLREVSTIAVQLVINEFGNLEKWSLRKGDGTWRFDCM